MRAIYPGSFDPITYGHLDIIERVAKQMDFVTIAVLENKSKTSMFSLEERIDMIKETTKHIENIEVDAFSGLLVDYAESKNCFNIIRGLRAVSDYEYEMQMALVNKELNKNIEFFFMPSNNKHVYLSSSIVREVSSFGGDISKFVPEYIIKKMENKNRRLS